MTASALYDGHLMHARFVPRRSSFRYRVFTWLIDLDELPHLSRRLRFFGSNRRALTSIHSRDHLGDPSQSIKDNVLAYLRVEGVELGGGRILMLTNARILGYVFDPITVFYCHNEAGELRCIVAEVHNTFGERHCYLMHPGSNASWGHQKEFHVSPFLSMDGEYRMKLPVPDARLRVDIMLEQGGREVLRAVLVGTRIPLTTRNLLRMLTKHVLLTHRITALIHWQAVRNLLRRYHLQRRPRHVAQEGVS